MIANAANFETPGDTDRIAIIAVVEAETQAFFDGDLDRWTECWLHDPRTSEAYCTREFGLKVIRGWDNVYAHMRGTFDKGIRCLMNRFENSNYLVTATKETAWAIYDQKNWHLDGETTETSFETRILEKHEGVWKIVFSSFTAMHPHYMPPGRIGVDADRNIVWSGPGAPEALKDHPGLTVSHGKLRATRSDWDQALADVLERAAQQHGFFDARKFADATGGPFRCPIVFGEDEDGRVVTCMATVQDGITYIDTDADGQITARLTVAEAIFGLSEAQTRLAAQIVSGVSLTAAAKTLGVTINTARTHLTRIYDKTGVNSQTALVRLLLSVG